MDRDKQREIASKGGRMSGGNFKNDRKKASRAGKISRRPRAAVATQSLALIQILNLAKSKRALIASGALFSYTALTDRTRKFVV